MQMYSAKLSCITMLLLVSTSLQAQVAYTATDSAAGPASPRPLSDAKAAQFDAAASLLGPVNLITFEGVALGNISNTTIASGVTINGVNNSNLPLTINNTPNFPSNPELDGYNTTLGGAKYVEMTGGALTFTFASPIQAFGAYITGPQPFFFIDTITFNDGTSQSITLRQPHNRSEGSASPASPTQESLFLRSLSMQVFREQAAISSASMTFVSSCPRFHQYRNPVRSRCLSGAGVPCGLFAVSRLRQRRNSKE